MLGLMKFIKDIRIRNAVLIGGLCSVSYLIVYIARNVLGAVTPQMLERDIFTTEYIGTLSSLYFIFYAVGQLINGMLGDKIKAGHMIGFGLLLAGICNLVFPYISHCPEIASLVYSMSGFFLSMIYGPMTKVVAENTEPVYTVRCSMGYEFAALLGTPLAGAIATFLAWEGVFKVGSVALFAMGVICLVLFAYLERLGIIKYNQYDRKKGEKISTSIGVLIQHGIIKFTMISIITGVVRTTVVFWLPTYISQYLGFSAEASAAIFTGATLAISMTTFIAIFVYERLDHNMNLTILLAFCVAAVAFLLVYFVRYPIVNIIFLVAAIMSSNSAATMMWSRYCPGLRDTGMVSSATGFLDFVSYMAAAASSTIFANAVVKIGWKNLILVWFALMIFGVMISLPSKQCGNDEV